MYNSGRKKVIISVISDLVTDQRVSRAANTLHEEGFEVILVGRILKYSLPMENRPYKVVRFKLWFNTGPLFYLTYNIRLFFFLIFKKADIYLSNDLDTLLANYTASIFKKVKLVYDSHEYFTEVPELINNPNKRSIWLRLEEWIFPHLKYAMTVNESIAGIYSKKYKIAVHVIRNVPAKINSALVSEQRKNWNIPEDAKVFLFQGAGINVDRGAEEAIEAIKHVHGAVLLFIGGGDVIDKLKKIVSEKKLNGKVFFIPKQPMSELMRFTRMADFGLTLDKDNNLNYRFSLPNKLFDYIHAGLPVLATNLPEVRKIVENYKIGLTIDMLSPENLSAKMLEMMKDENQLDTWKKNLLIAASDLSWKKNGLNFYGYSLMSLPLNLHLIAFDIPYPPNYGGVIDIFYKLKALHAEGVKVYLHCYEYARGPSEELNKYAEKVYYYPRLTAKSQLFNTYPYIVLTRRSADLKANLLNDDYPILMEGLHSTYFLGDPAFAGRMMMVRTHNVEHEYYENLARVEKNIFKKYYFFNEAGKLLKYEAILHKANAIAAISPSDTAHFLHSFSGVHYIPAFHPFDQVKIIHGKSDFAFYHGNLAVGENNEGALYLVEKVFNDLPFKLIIAGNKPSSDLKKAVKSSPNTVLMDNLSFMEIQKYISEAQCNLLPTFQSTGIKLKLISALFIGRKCIVNTPMVLNTELESLCTIADTPEAMKEAVTQAMHEGFSDQEIAKRKEVLLKNFSNSVNAKKLIAIFS